MDATTALIELLLLLAVGLLTPGPNALTSFAHSGLFGKKANIPSNHWNGDWICFD